MLPHHQDGWSAICADPPWAFKTFSDKGLAKSAQAHYGCMTLAEIQEMPVQEIAGDDCALFMWATFPMLPQALATMEAWGFSYKSGGPWAKQSKTGRKWSFGTGFIFRSAAELLLVGSRGKPTYRSKSERNLWVAPVREHSRKPDCVMDMIERHIEGPKLNLFARESRPGWTTWGHEAEKFD